jgi:hypothetical protein
LKTIQSQLQEWSVLGANTQAAMHNSIVDEVNKFHQQLGNEVLRISVSTINSNISKLMEDFRMILQLVEIFGVSLLQYTPNMAPENSLASLLMFLLWNIQSP